MQRRAFLRSSLSAAGAAPFLRLSPSFFSEDATVDHDIRRLSEEAELAMLFGGTTAAECRAWQNEFRATLTRLLGKVTPPEKWIVEEEGRRELDDHIRYELLLKADRVASLPLYLLVPRGAGHPRKHPTVLCVHGHGAYGHHPVVGRTDFDDPR